MTFIFYKKFAWVNKMSRPSGPNSTLKPINTNKIFTFEIFICLRAREIHLTSGLYNFNGFLGNCATDLAPIMEHPVQQQEGYRQLPRFKFNEM